MLGDSNSWHYFPVWASFESEDIMTYELDLILVVNGGAV